MYLHYICWYSVDTIHTQGERGRQVTAVGAGCGMVAAGCSHPLYICTFIIMPGRPLSPRTPSVCVPFEMHAQTHIHTFPLSYRHHHHQQHHATVDNNLVGGWGW